MKVWTGILAALVLAGTGVPSATAGVNMQGVNMQGVNMQGVNMQGVNMQGVNMQGVNMQGVNMQGTRVNQLAAHPESTSTGLRSMQVRVVGGRLFLAQK